MGGVAWCNIILNFLDRLEAGKATEAPDPLARPPIKRTTGGSWRGAGDSASPTS